MAQSSLTFIYSIKGDGTKHLIVEIYNINDYSTIVDIVSHPPVTTSNFTAHYTYSTMQDEGTYVISLYESNNGVSKDLLLGTYYKSNKPLIGREIEYNVGASSSLAKARDGENTITDPSLAGVNVLFVSIEGRGIIGKSQYIHDPLTGVLVINNRGARFSQNEIIIVFVY